MLKALHITYRFGKEVIGGAEYFHYKIAQHLAKLGVDITILATQTRNVPHLTRFGVRWDNSLKKYEEYDGIKIHRFPVYTLPKPVMGILGKILQSRWEKEEQQTNISNLIKLHGGGVLGTGWHYPERYGDITLRWTQKKFQIIIFDEFIKKIIIEANSYKSNTLQVNVNGNKSEIVYIKPNWNVYEIDIGNVKNPIIDFTVLSTFSPLKDIRNLGVQIKAISYISEQGEKYISLDRDYKNYFDDKKNIDWIAILQNRARNRSRIYDHIFDFTRGPISIEMMRFIKKNIQNYDIIFGANMPFATFNIAAKMAKKFKKPYVLLPLAHIEDDFYHWEKYYDSMKDADRVLALTPFSKENLFDIIGAKTDVIGAGIEIDEFEDIKISKKEFKEKFQLGDIPILLFVGRKSLGKKYDILIKAVEELNVVKKQQCLLLMIGPNEDNEQITSPYVRYLGAVDRNTLLAAYNVCDIFSIMSESESFGMVVLEARMFKKPVIVSKNCGALASLIDDGFDGFLCSNKEDVIEKVSILLNNKDFSYRLGEKGYNKTVENFTWEKVAKKVKTIYEEITNY